MTDQTGLKILDTIKSFIGIHGFPPSIREIMNRTNITSTSVVTRHLKKLDAEGYIDHIPDIARGIVLKDYHPSATVPRPKAANPLTQSTTKFPNP